MVENPASVPPSGEIEVRDGLVARMCHDLRTPIGAVLTWLELLKVHATEPKAMRALEAAQASARDLVEIVSGIEEAQSLVAGTLAVQTTSIDLVGLVSEAADRLGPRGEARGVSVKADLGAERVLVRADGLRLRHAFDRLLSNCVSLSGPGVIELELRTDQGAARVIIACPSLAFSAALERALLDESEWPSLVGTNGQARLDFAVAGRLLRLQEGRVEAEAQPGAAGVRLSASLPLA